MGCKNGVSERLLVLANLMLFYVFRNFFATRILGLFLDSHGSTNAGTTADLHISATAEKNLFPMLERSVYWL